MILYLSIIAIGTAAIAVLTGVFSSSLGFSAGYAVLASIISVLVCIAIDAIIAIIVRVFPQKLYAPDRKFFTEHKWERRFYERLGIRFWKDKIPETGKLLVKFGKSKIEQKDNPEYLYKFLTELGYAEIMHWVSAAAGFLVIFILPLSHALYFGIPVGIVNFILQIPPAMVQRYNRPRLLKLYTRTLNKHKQSGNTDTQADA